MNEYYFEVFFKAPASSNPAEFLTSDIIKHTNPYEALEQAKRMYKGDGRYVCNFRKVN
jgi:hypothetical protein